MNQTIRSSPITLCLLLSFLTLLLIYPTESRDAAYEGLRLCITLIIPSLFPFFVLSSLFISMGYVTMLSRFLTPLLWPLFRLNGSCSAAILLGAVGGYPVGLRTASELYERRACTKEELLHLSAFYNNCGPAFLISVAGIGVFQSKIAGFLLLFTHLFSALFVGFLFKFFFRTKFSNIASEDTLPPASSQRFTDAFPNCVKQAFLSTLHISAFVIFFFVFLRLLSASGILPWVSGQLSKFPLGPLTPALCDSLLHGIFEISSGLSKLAEASSSFITLPLASWILSWGGFSVHCQSVSFLSHCGVSSAPYLAGKILQGIVAAGSTALLLPFLFPHGLSIPVSSFPILHSPIPMVGHIQQGVFILWLCSGLYLLFQKLR